MVSARSGVMRILVLGISLLASALVLDPGQRAAAPDAAQ
jgi:hypothetical protein